MREYGTARPGARIAIADGYIVIHHDRIAIANGRIAIYPAYRIILSRRIGAPRGCSVVPDGCTALLDARSLIRGIYSAMYHCHSVTSRRRTNAVCSRDR